MKNAIFRFLAIMLALLFVLSISIAETDYSSLNIEELNKIVNAAKTEITNRQIKEKGYVLVSDEFDVKIYFYGFKNNYDEKIQFVVMNNSNQNLVVCIEKLYIENWDVLLNGYHCTLDPGKNEIGESFISWEKCLTSNEAEASKIDVVFSFSDENWEELYRTEEKTFYIN